MEKALKRRETVTVTLRIDKDIMNKLALDADNDSISLNSLVNHVLKRYVEWNKFEDKSSMIPINSIVLKELFRIMDKEQVIKLAKDVAKDAVYSLILFMNGKVDFKILMSWHKERMRHCSEISEKQIEDNQYKIIFKHDLGENWSLYHKTILESICHEYLSKPIEIGITSSTVVINANYN
jgi:hypothetical protein